MGPLNRDPQLRQQAKARARFQSSVVVNAALWIIWALTDHQHEGMVPWSVWATAFWGFGLVMRGMAAYGSFSHEQRTQREYKRLVRERGSDPLGRYR